MKFSTTYLFFPANRALERAIADSIGMLGRDRTEGGTQDKKVAVADNVLYTRGPFDQHRFSASILESMREALEASLADERREKEPLARAEGWNRLGNILGALGQLHRDVALYEQAIQCFDAALEELDQQDRPLDWAAAQYNLGTAKQALGRQLRDSKLLKASIDAYTNALLVWSREDTPEEWASAMHQLGATFHAYGGLLKGNRTFQKSVVAYKNAIAVLDADNHALELAAAHNNRGAVLHNLGESEENPDRLEEAIRAYETALTVCMEQQLPIHLAVLCRVNKATARGVLAELTNAAAVADEVADEFDLIIECFPHALPPLCSRHCEEQLNRARLLASAPVPSQ